MFLQKYDVGDLPPAPTHLFAISRNCFLKRKFVHRKRDRVILLWNHVISGWFCTIYFPEFLSGCFLSIFICWQQTCLVIGLICVSWNHCLAPHVLGKCYKTSSLEQSHCICFSFWEYLNPGNFINNSIRNSGKFRNYVFPLFWTRLCPVTSVSEDLPEHLLLCHHTCHFHQKTEEPLLICHSIRCMW